MEDKKTIRCHVREDSVYEILQGILIDVVRDKAFYRIVRVHSDNNPLSPEIRAQYVGKTSGREQLDFKNSIESEVDESKDIPEFETGAKRDSEGKEDYVETQSFLAMQRYAVYMTSQAKKYGRGNWRKGIPISSYEESFMRHMHKYFANKYDNANLEPEVDHLAAMRFNLDGIMHEEEKNKLKEIK